MNGGKDNMKELTVSFREAGQRMDKYLFKVLNQAPKSFVYKMLRKKNIVLNEKKASGQEILQEKDRIQIYFSDETFAKFAAALPDDPEKKNGSEPYRKPGQNSKGIEGKKKGKPQGNSSFVSHPLYEKLAIVYEDDDILILNKPAGLLSQKAKDTDVSANELVIDYLIRSGQLSRQELRTFHPSVCNRLDRNTSGLLIAGKTMKGLQEMSAALKARSMKKYYRCLVAGVVRKDAHLKGYLKKNKKTNRVTITQQPEDGAAYIETSWHPICVYQDMTLLEVHLITGRSHQIRAHLASIGHPILGDAKYGNAKLNSEMRARYGVRGQLLHAYRMEFPDGRVVTAPEPELFSLVQKGSITAAQTP